MQKHQGLARRPAYVLMGLLALVVILCGGSSRFDQTQVIALRPLACLFLIPALWYASGARLAQVRVPLALLLALAGWAALQLVPLPPSIWHSLPGRDVIVALDSAVGLTDQWRPLTLTPMRTLNMLASLIVPLAVLMLFAAQRDISGSFVHYALIIAAVLNAALGSLQIAGGVDSVFYTYAITNSGSPVGFFANRNHSAVFGALAMLSIAYLLFAKEAGRRGSLRSIALGAAYVFIFGVALASQSRAGLLMCIAALFLTLSFALWQGALTSRTRSEKRSHSSAEHQAGTTDKRNKAISLVVAGLSMVAVLGLLVFADRIPALERFGSDGLAKDLRWSITPTLTHMVGTYFPWGSGFGSFEQAYYIHEKADLLSPSYINQAHNDWLQLVIEGGVIAMILLAAILVWLIRALFKIAQGTSDDRLSAAYWVGTLIIISFASLFDYPLRTPIFAMFAAWLIGDLAVRLAQSHKRAGAAAV